MRGGEEGRGGGPGGHMVWWVGEHTKGEHTHTHRVSTHTYRVSDTG